jgi:coenzyme F420-reducing hydrogenase alpha subunit
VSRKIHLKKATRIEGNADIKIEIEDGRVKAANFMVHDFRGFEKFMQGRRVEFVPHMISRICGLCSSSQQIASLRAIEDAIDIDVPEPVKLLREVILLGERIASHSLSYFYLTMPDQLGAPGGIFQIMKERPESAEDALNLRRYGQDIVKLLGGRSVHPVSMGIGSFLKPPGDENIDKVREISGWVMKKTAALIEKSYVQVMKSKRRISFPEDIPVNHLVYGEHGDNGRCFQIITREGKVSRTFSSSEFEENISELRADWSFAKLPFIKDMGFPEGIMMTGPLSRAMSSLGVLSDSKVSGFPLARDLASASGLTLESYDVCRLLEIYQAAANIAELLEGYRDHTEERVMNLDRDGYGYGVVEAPRGTLVHNYVIHRGRIEKMHLLVATQFNNAYINLFLKDISSGHVEGNSLTPEGEELVARCVRIFDPCLSCATH